MKLLYTILVAFLITFGSIAQTTVTIDSTKKMQTIEGWGDGGGILGILNFTIDTAIGNPLNKQTLDFLVDEYGLTGSRTWEVGPRIDGTGMDNGNCDSIDWTKFQVGVMDPRTADYLVYFKNRIVAQGFQPSFYSSPGYPTHATDQKPWVMNHPGERAQQIWANALWWKNNYGININYDVIYNEPNGAITSTILADDIKALGPRLIAKGLSTKSQYAEGVAPQTDWGFITPEQNDSDLWPFVGRLSYHNYGTADPYRSYIRDFGLSKGIPTAQTEMYDPNIDNLFDDLTLGGVTYWEVAYSGSLVLIPSAGNTSYTPGAKFFRNRQLLHYVRPGAIRIGATSSDSTFRVLSFNQSGAVTTVLLNNKAAAITVNLSGLPPGTYGLSQSAGSMPTELGTVTVGGAGTLTINNLAGSGMATTLYPYSGINNAPAILTWGANPGYLVSPTSTASLTVKANDPELNTLTYLWSVASQPGGANAIIATPTTATTNVSGLTVAGNYIFNIDVKDGVNTSSRKVYLVVYGTNPPPMMGQSGFRIAAPYGLVFGDPSDTTHANIELPTSSATLQVGIGDLANSDFTGRGTWTLVKQPAGASAIVGATTYIYVSIRADVTGMTVPGDYVFQVNITNPGFADLTTQIICTVHAASTGPVINSITATPPSLTLPASSTKLTAVTTDPQGQLLRHWWVLKTVPAGANPTFTNQGLPVTNVTGLTVAGKYVFTLRAFDDIHMTTQDITVMVYPMITGIDPAVQKVSANNFVVYPNPAGNYFTIETGVTEKQLLQLFDVTGNLVLTQNIQSDKIKIDTYNLPEGIFNLCLTSNDQKINKRLVIVR